MNVITRRSLLAQIAASATSVAMVPGRHVISDRTGYPWPLGVQLWSVFAELTENFDGTLRRLAELGYSHVESAGWMGRGADEFRRSVEAAGLRCDSAHIAMPKLAADMSGSVAQARDAGCEYLFCSSPQTPTPVAAGINWLTALAEAMTLDAWKRNAALLNDAASIAAAAGIKFGYHNHTAEFARYDGLLGYDVLFAETDPQAVLLELDIAWAAAAGQNPVRLIGSNKGRIARLHLKDLKAQSTPGEMAPDFTTVPVGKGTVDWPSVITEARISGVSGAYVELERSHLRSPFEELAESGNFLKNM